MAQTYEPPENFNNAPGGNITGNTNTPTNSTSAHQPQMNPVVSDNVSPNKTAGQPLESYPQAGQISAGQSAPEQPSATYPQMTDSSIPGAYPAPPTAQVPAEPKKKSKKGLWIALIIVLIVVILAIVGIVVGNSALKKNLEAGLAEEYRNEGMTNPQVTIKDKWVLLSMFNGRLDHVMVKGDSATVDNAKSGEPMKLYDIAADLKGLDKDTETVKQGDVTYTLKMDSLQNEFKGAMKGELANAQVKVEGRVIKMEIPVPDLGNNALGLEMSIDGVKQDGKWGFRMSPKVTKTPSELLKPEDFASMMKEEFEPFENSLSITEGEIKVNEIKNLEDGFQLSLTGKDIPIKDLG